MTWTLRWKWIAKSHFFRSRCCGRAARNLVAASTTIISAFRGTDFRSSGSHCAGKVQIEWSKGATVNIVKCFYACNAMFCDCEPG